MIISRIFGGKDLIPCYLVHDFKDPCFKSPSFKIFTVPLGIRPLGTAFEFNYLSEFKTKFEKKNLKYEPGLNME
jgi:hypothetical protein